MSRNTEKQPRSAMIDTVLMAATLIVLLISPTQYAVEIRKNVFVSLVDPLVWLIGGAWWLREVVAGRLKKLAWPPLVTWIFLGVAALSLTRADQRMTGLKDIIQIVEYLVVAFMLFRALLNDARGQTRAMYTLALTGLVILSVTALQFLSPETSDELVRGTFGNRNVLGGYLALLLPLLLAASLFGKGKGWRIVCGAAVASGIVLCLSGGAWIGLMPALLLLGFLRGRRAGLLVLTAGLVIVALILPRLPRHDREATFESVELFSPEGTVSPRYTEWQAAAVMVLENPLRGVGVGNYQNNIGRYYGTLPNPPGSKTPPDTQNLYLVIASTMGIPGLLAYLALLAAGMANAIRHLKSTNRVQAAGALASLMAFSVASIWSPLLVRGIGIPLAFVLALAFTPSSTADEKQS